MPVSVFGKRLKLLRNEIDGLTQEKLGKVFNVEKGTVSNWENGNRFPNENMLIKIANHFDVSVDYLLGRTKKRQPHHLTKEDIVKIAPQYKWLFDKEGLEYVELVEELRGKEIPPEAIRELVDTILKYRHFNK